MRARLLSGAGNRFVVVDAWDERLDGAALAQSLADVADGVLTLASPTDAGSSFRMRVHNRDGSLARMCGNGLRCAVAAGRRWGRAEPGDQRVETDLGALEIRLDAARPDWVECEVGVPELAALAVPTRLPATPRVELAVVLREAGLDPAALERARPEPTAFVLAVGGPHLVVFVADVDAVPFDALGPLLERHPAFPDRANVHFAARVDAGFRVRTWERGAGPTAACGTGAAAVAVAGADLEATETRVRSTGGTLDVRWPGRGNAAWVGGPTQDEGPVSLAGPASVATPIR